MIEVLHLSKEYGGVQALRDVSFSIPSGSIFGFIGPNGAGKTTTLKILGTLLRPTEGTAQIMGLDVMKSSDEVRRVVGWMPDQYGLYLQLRAWEYLDFFAGAHRIPRGRRREVVEEVLELIGLASKRDTLVGELSRGMTQKLCLGRALVHDPKVLLLDEPASGLDPQARIELKELFKKLQRSGKTLLVSSHILAELSEYCDGIAIIQEGQVRFSGTLQELSTFMAAGRRRVRLGLLEDPGRAKELLTSRPEVKKIAAVEGGKPELELELEGDDAALAELLAFLVSEKVKVAGFRELEMDLGDVFIKITHGAYS